MDSTGEGIPQDNQSYPLLAHASKTPVTVTNMAARKKMIKELERPSSAKTVCTLENKYKSTLIKFKRELKEIQIQNEKLSNVRDQMQNIREELIERGFKDPPSLPEFPTLQYNKKLTKDGSGKCQNTYERTKKIPDEMMRKYHQENEVLETISAEIPVLEKTFKNLEESLNLAQEKQGDIENTLEVYKVDISNMLSNSKQVDAMKVNSSLLMDQLKSIQDQFQIEKTLLKNEIDAKDEDISKLRKCIDNESMRRKDIEDALMTVREEKERMQVNCENYKDRVDMLQKMFSTATSATGKQDGSVINSQFKEVFDDMNVKLISSQEKLKTMILENERLRFENCQLLNEKEAMKNELVHQSQQSLFNKENRIYFIKSKMDSIVNLKNNVVSREASSEPFYSLELLMTMSDSNALKKQIVCLHQKMQDNEDCKADLESRLAAKETVIQEFKNKVSLNDKALREMDKLVKMLKMRDKQTCELLARFNILQHNHNWNDMFDGEKRAQELMKWQIKQRNVVLSLEQQLRQSAEKHSLAEERRIRNEERIAILQTQLAKQSYLR